MLGIGAGALGVAVAAKVASAVVDTPVSLPNNEVDHETFLDTMGSPASEQNKMIDLEEIDWTKWAEEFVDKQDVIRDTPPIVPSGSFNSYEWKHNYINSDLVIRNNEMNMQSIQIPNVEISDHALDAYRAWSDTKGWDRNE